MSIPEKRVDFVPKDSASFAFEKPELKDGMRIVEWDGMPSGSFFSFDNLDANDMMWDEMPITNPRIFILRIVPKAVVTPVPVAGRGLDMAKLLRERDERNFRVAEQRRQAGLPVFGARGRGGAFAAGPPFGPIVPEPRAVPAPVAQPRPPPPRAPAPFAHVVPEPPPPREPAPFNPWSTLIPGELVAFPSDIKIQMTNPCDSIHYHTCPHGTFSEAHSILSEGSAILNLDRRTSNMGDKNTRFARFINMSKAFLANYGKTMTLSNTIKQANIYKSLGDFGILFGKRWGELPSIPKEQIDQAKALNADERPLLNILSIMSRATEIHNTVLTPENVTELNRQINNSIIEICRFLSNLPNPYFDLVAKTNQYRAELAQKIRGDNRDLRHELERKREENGRELDRARIRMDQLRSNLGGNDFAEGQDAYYGRELIKLKKQKEEEAWGMTNTAQAALQAKIDRLERMYSGKRLPELSDARKIQELKELGAKIPGLEYKLSFDTKEQRKLIQDEAVVTRLEDGSYQFDTDYIDINYSFKRYYDDKGERLAVPIGTVKPSTAPAGRGFLGGLLSFVGLGGKRKKGSHFQSKKRRLLRKRKTYKRT